MTACYLDSNFLIYSKNESAVQYKTAVAVLRELVENKTRLLISPLVLDEFIHSFGFFLKKSRKQFFFDTLAKVVTEILNLPKLEVADIPSDKNSQLLVLDFMEKYSLCPRDAYHLLVIQANNIDSFATFDTDFKKVFSEGLVEKI